MSPGMILVVVLVTGGLSGRFGDHGCGFGHGSVGVIDLYPDQRCRPDVLLGGR